MPEPSTIDALLRFRAAHDGAKTAVVDPATRITYDELDATPASWLRSSSTPVSARAPASA